MKKGFQQILEMAISALELSCDHSNRPWGRGSTDAVLILLDHSFEALIKAAIRHISGKIRKARENQTVGFGSCAWKGLTDASVKFLTDEQALTLQSINGMRSSALDRTSLRRIRYVRHTMLWRSTSTNGASPR